MLKQMRYILKYMACIFCKVPCIFRHAGNMLPQNVYCTYDMQHNMH